MKISKNSWHYRVYSKMFDRPPTSVCPYFWKVLFSIVTFIPFRILVFTVANFILYPVALIIGLMIGTIPLVSSWKLFLFPNTGDWESWSYSPLRIHRTYFYPIHLLGPVLLSFFAGFDYSIISTDYHADGFFYSVVLLVQFIFTFSAFQIWKVEFPEIRQLVSKQELPESASDKSSDFSSVFFAYLRAKKEKFCPAIDLVE